MLDGGARLPHLFNPVNPMLKPKQKKPSEPRPTLSAAAILKRVRTALNHQSGEDVPTRWLDTGDPQLNQVLGSDAGIPYGKLLEISGMESGGKTTIALYLAGLAQKDGATVVWLDFEGSWDPVYSAKKGVDPKAVVLLQPYVGSFAKGADLTLSTAEVLCEEAAVVVQSLYRANQQIKLFLVVDSIVAMSTSAEDTAGLTGQNLRTKMSLPAFLGHLMRAWCGMAISHSAIIIFINQLRENPMAFGDPLYSPGGNAPRFYCHIRVRAKGVKGRKLMRKGQQIGIQGVLTNIKNKAGGVERQTIGYKLLFDGRTLFLPAEKLSKAEE